MANKKISTLDDIELVGGTSTAGIVGADVIPVTDVSDTTGSAQGTTKKVTVTDLINLAPQGDLESTNNLSDLNDAATARTNLGLGTASTADTGTGANNVVQLDGTAKLPAVDGSQLTNLPGGSSLSIVTPTFTGTPLAYTLTSSDNGKVVVVNESVTAYITVPQSLGSGFNCTIAQQGTGTAVLLAGTGVSVIGLSSKVATVGQYGVMDLVPVATDSYYVTGDTTTAPFLNTYSASFDGIDDHLYFGTSPTNKDITVGTTDFAVSMWFYPTTTSQIFLFRSTSGSQRVFIVNGTLTIKGYGTQVDITSAYSTNNWYHLVIERTSGTQKVYIDNVLKSTVSSQTGSFNIGNIGHTSTSGFFAGKMDEISFHSQGLSSSDVSAMYNSGAPIDLSGSYNTTGWWRMGDDFSGTTINDQVGSEDLTASGANLQDTSVPS